MLFKDSDHKTIWILEGVLRDGKIWCIPINSIPFRIGRSKDCHVSLSCNTVSRFHAEILQDVNTLLIRDLGSANGTYVNNEIITKKTRIKEGDIIHFDELEFRVRSKKLSDFKSSTETHKAIDTKKHHSSSFVSCEDEFHEMLSQEAIVPFFQPIVNINTSHIIGYEVLGRCRFKGLPSNIEKLFKIAANLGYETQLSEIMRKKGLQEGNVLLDGVMLFLNTHQNELFKASLINSLYELRKSFPDRGIVLEIHEKAVTNLELMKKLKLILSELDIKLAYDDFGAGQSRLIELVEFTPDYLKFDISLIRNIHRAPMRKQEMLARLVRMVNDLNICSLAEGVESEQECEFCRQIGFIYAQGYLFGKPDSIDGYRKT